MLDGAHGIKPIDDVPYMAAFEEIATASANTCSNPRLSPTTLPTKLPSCKPGGGVLRLKSKLGVSSSATPVKCANLSQENMNIVSC